MEDLLSCMVCCEPYQEKMRHPVLLPRCGHSFCRPCIAFMVKGGNVVCPSCRMDQRVETADDLPTEFSLLAITAAQQVAKLETCQVHDVKLSFWCKSCKMATCGECLFEDHPTHSHDVIKATRYIIEMKDAINDLANKFMETLDIRERRLYDMVYKSAKGINDALRTICVLRKDMEEARDLMKGVKKVDGIAPTTRLSEAAKFLGLKWNLHDAKLGLGPASLKKDQAKAQGEKKEAELQKEAEEKKQDSPEENEEDKGKEDIAKEDKEKEGDDKTKQAKDGESNDKEDDDDEDEGSTDESEEEVLTEEEVKKRQKILKVKERIAAAAAAAAAEKELKEKKLMEKERKAVKEKNNNASSEPEQVPSPKLLKPWKKRPVVAPVSREPSITPEREVEKKEKSEKIESPTEKEDANKQSDKARKSGKRRQAKERGNRSQSRKQRTEQREGEQGDEGDGKQPPSEERREPRVRSHRPPKAATEPPNASPAKDKEKDKEKAKEEAEAKREAETKKEAKKAPSTAKRPRGRLARQALKRAQTMDLSKRVQADGDKEEGEAESQNIKGLDLETGKSNKPEEAENKENEAGATGEAREEAKDDKKEKEEKEEEKAEEEKKKEEEARGATAAKEDEEGAMFELDPDEKDRIATELMMVPSLTVCVEGRGGLMARVQWEPQGLHVYSHQAQDLPYDVLIKSSVLNALIPTKSPTVFLDIEYEQRMLGRVYITLFGHLRRASNFLLLCTGETGASLKSSKFFEVCNPEAPGERLKGGDYEFNNGRGGEALVEELEFGGDYAQPMEAGMITAGGSGHRCFDSQFLICTEGDPNRSFACPFGVVTSGLSYLKEAVWLVVTKEIWIEECGVLLDVPRF
ncbi:LOW QUALITY PROTEIN: uncharacterized protein ZK546.14-like [Penaeus monodon]|uniref:LOW QUALITY PROTEIN: uncharacterized protein ZK546.14-like n=1 Tax=Penaeus monodon TaxID=6687 RepID=UPI0018A7A86C|nr:LOW QUALITY PROTEIN: uncharacterized protein ZK546.14-like [Penaeus monodon]